jgi:ABC-type lipoprotein release transport system permease subunit
MAALGVVAGGLAAASAVSYIDRVFAVGAIGVLPFVYAAAIVAVVAVTASSLPASRAALLSPISAIRNEPDSLWQAARLRLRRALGQR